MLWVIGKEGLVGSAICRKMSCLATAKREVDITDLRSLRAFVREHPSIATIMNTAAFTQVDAAEKEPAQAYQVNVIGAQNVAIVAREMGAKLIHFSTDYVFDGKRQSPLTEEDSTGPLNVYGQTKLEGEQRIFQALPSACILRSSAIFGVGGKSFLSKLCHLMRTQERLYLTDDQTNSPTYVEDLVDAALEMTSYSGVFHFANQGLASKYTFALQLRKAMLERGEALKVKEFFSVSSDFFSQCCVRPRYSVLDTAKIQKILSFPILPWKESLKRSLSSCVNSILF